jgi:hypothetical protein
MAQYTKEVEFEFGGFRFTPKGQFKDYGIKENKDEFKNIATRLDYSHVITPANYEHSEFYKAAGNISDDLFVASDGRLYCPTDKNLVCFRQDYKQ